MGHVLRQSLQTLTTVKDRGTLGRIRVPKCRQRNPQNPILLKKKLESPQFPSNFEEYSCREAEFEKVYPPLRPQEERYMQENR